jgi:hypothetical protein
MLGRTLPGCRETIVAGPMEELPMTAGPLPEHLQRLVRFGDDATLRAGVDGWHDYVARFGMSPADAPHLLAIMQQWFDFSDEREAADLLPGPEWCAPIHAWRALGQLKILDAIEPMLAHADRLDEEMDDWSLEDWPHVFALIGPSALPRLVEHQADASHREYSRVLAIESLELLAKRHPETRGQIVAVFASQLELLADEPTVNGFLVSSLLSLEAKDKADVIERAYAADVVDEQSCGGWGEVRDQLGVPGLGLAQAERRPRWWPRNAQFRDKALRFDAGAPLREREAAKREKAKRKAAQKSRKHNRRGR